MLADILNLVFTYYVVIVLGSAVTGAWRSTRDTTLRTQESVSRSIAKLFGNRQGTPAAAPAKPAAAAGAKPAAKPAAAAGPATGPGEGGSLAAGIVWGFAQTTGWVLGVSAVLGWRAGADVYQVGKRKAAQINARRRGEDTPDVDDDGAPAAAPPPTPAAPPPPQPPPPAGPRGPSLPAGGQEPEDQPAAPPAAQPADPADAPPARDDAQDQDQLPDLSGFTVPTSKRPPYLYVVPSNVTEEKMTMAAREITTIPTLISWTSQSAGIAEMEAMDASAAADNATAAVEFSAETAARVQQELRALDVAIMMMTALGVDKATIAAYQRQREALGVYHLRVLAVAEACATLAQQARLASQAASYYAETSLVSLQVVRTHQVPHLIAAQTTGHSGAHGAMYEVADTRTGREIPASSGTPLPSGQ